MRYWILKAKDDQEPDYDVANGFVVAAASAKDARVIAAMNCGDEGPDYWMDSSKSTCGHLPTYPAKPRLIMRDFNNG